MNIINDSVNLGFMAQEVEKVIPEVVVHTAVQNVNIDKQNITDNQISQESYGMKYAELIPVLTKAIQEQQKEIESYKSRIEKLEAIVKNLLEEKN